MKSRGSSMCTENSKSLTTLKICKFTVYCKYKMKILTTKKIGHFGLQTFRPPFIFGLSKSEEAFCLWRNIPVQSIVVAWACTVCADKHYII